MNTAGALLDGGEVYVRPRTFKDAPSGLNGIK